MKLQIYLLKCLQVTEIDLKNSFLGVTDSNQNSFSGTLEVFWFCKSFVMALLIVNDMKIGATNKVVCAEVEFLNGDGQFTVSVSWVNHMRIIHSHEQLTIDTAQYFVDSCLPSLAEKKTNGFVYLCI